MFDVLVSCHTIWDTLPPFSHASVKFTSSEVRRHLGDFYWTFKNYAGRKTSKESGILISFPPEE